MNIDHLIDALNLGVEAAERNVSGYVFIGANPEAEAEGYVQDTPEFNVFVSAFLDTLPVSVTAYVTTGEIV